MRLSIMPNGLLYFAVTTAIAVIVSIPLLGQFDRSTRLSTIHRLFSLRHSIVSSLTGRSNELSSDAKSLVEIFSLYHPKLDLSDHPTPKEIELLRHHSRLMFHGLLPKKPSACRIEQQIFHVNGRPVRMYFIHHERIENWRISPRPLVLYFHGGGFVFGGEDTYFGFECHLSNDLNMMILHVDFGLAPEQPLHQTMQDLIGVYQILQQTDPSIHRRLIGMGDSSGGMLWIYLLQWLVAHKQPVPRAVVLHSPWTSLDLTSIEVFIDTDEYMSAEMVFNVRQLIIGTKKGWAYLSDEERNTMSPKEDAFEGFPPLYITAGTQDAFFNEIHLMTKRIHRAGGNVMLDVSDGSIHSFALFHLWSSEARHVQKNAREWINEQLLRPLESLWNELDSSPQNCT